MTLVPIKEGAGWGDGDFYRERDRQAHSETKAEPGMEREQRGDRVKGYSHKGKEGKVPLEF